jgi:hypothetical protein
MEAGAERRGLGAEVAHAQRALEPAVRQRVGDLERERERVSRLRMEHVAERHALGRAPQRAPVDPEDEPVQRGRALGLGEREALVAVAAVAQPVRPGCEHLAAELSPGEPTSKPSSSSRTPTRQERSAAPTSVTTARWPGRSSTYCQPVGGSSGALAPASMFAIPLVTTGP